MTAFQASRGHDLKRQTLIAMVWNLLGRGSTTFTGFAVFLLLARLLTPTEFGIYALASAFVDCSRVIANSGWMDAVVRSRTLDDELLDTAFWANLGLGTIVAALSLALTLPYAHLTGHPEVAGLLWWLAPLIPVSCLSSVHIGRALHGFGYRELAIRTAFANLVAGVAAVIAASRGLGVWSLVVQAVVADVVGVVAAWIAWPWMPGRRFSWSRFRELFAFTSSMMLTQLLWLLLMRVPDIFIARSLGPAAVGAYRIGCRMFEILGQVVTGPVAAVGITTFSRMRERGASIERAYVRIIGILAFVIFPIMGGFAVVAQDAIPLVFGPRWEPSIPVAQILMAVMVPYLLSLFDAPVLAAAGRPGALSRIAAVQLVLTMAMAWLWAPSGLVVLTATASVARSFLTLPYQQYLIYREAGIRPWMAWRAIVVPLAATGGMAVAVLGARPVLAAAIASPPLLLAALVATGAACYVGLLLAFARDLLLENARFLLSAGRRREVAL